MTNTGVLEKFNELKDAAFWTKMIAEVKRVDNLEMIFSIMQNIKSRSMMIFPDTVGMFSDNDSIRMTVIIADKISGSNDDDDLILQSYDDGLSALKIIISKMNYNDGENIILDEVKLSTFRPEGTDWIATTVTTTFDFAFDIIPNVKPLLNRDVPGGGTSGSSSGSHPVGF